MRPSFIRASGITLALRLVAALMVLLWSSPPRVDLPTAASSRPSITEKAPHAISAQRPVAAGISEAKAFSGSAKKVSLDDALALSAARDRLQAFGQARALQRGRRLKAHPIPLARARGPPSTLV